MLNPKFEKNLKSSILKMFISKDFLFERETIYWELANNTQNTLNVIFGLSSKSVIIMRSFA
jgi:hypothetical protein